MPSHTERPAIAGDIDLNQYIGAQIARDLAAKAAANEQRPSLEFKTVYEPVSAAPSKDQMMAGFRSMATVAPGQEVRPSPVRDSYQIQEAHIGPAGRSSAPDTATAAGFNPNHDYLGSFRSLASQTAETQIAERAVNYDGPAKFSLDPDPAHSCGMSPGELVDRWNAHAAETGNANITASLNFEGKCEVEFSNGRGGYGGFIVDHGQSIEFHDKISAQKALAVIDGRSNTYEKEIYAHLGEMDSPAMRESVAQMSQSLDVPIANLKLQSASQSM